MANYRGRTFTSACSHCGDVFTATHQHKADAQADSCYENHFPRKLREPEEILQELRDHLGDDYPGQTREHKGFLP